VSTFTSFAGKLQAELTGATTRTTSMVDMPLAGTEYSFPIPDGTKQYLIKLRFSGTLQVADQPGASGTNYIEVPSWCFLSEDFLTTSGLTLYFQSPKPSQVLEVITWT
jgi:hypothetical protein